MSRKKRVASILFLCLTPMALAAAEAGWQKLFDGKTMNGWRLMAVHGGNGGVWAVESGALVANQEKDHKGGLIGTEKKYADYEIELEFKADYPVDTGLFLRVRDDGMGYQITIDHRKDGFIGSLYAPAAGDFIQQNHDWPKYFKKDAWNKLRARIEGQPAHVVAWLNDVKMTDFKDNRDRYPREGYIGLQVHGGEGAWGDTARARFRNIRIRELSK
ncbi:MAG: 3-keto-disaccharide hydrolase [Blastocatellia bacterium]